MKIANAVDKPRVGSRRSHRLKLQVPVVVTRHGSNGVPLEEVSTMLNVNAFGGMVILRAHVERGETLRVTNKATLEEQECRVINIGPVTPIGTKIGIAFTKPAPDFWRIYFPTVDPRSKHHRPQPGQEESS
jgi:hypothetical protein